MEFGIQATAGQRFQNVRLKAIQNLNSGYTRSFTANFTKEGKTFQLTINLAHSERCEVNEFFDLIEVVSATDILLIFEEEPEAARTKFGLDTFQIDRYGSMLSHIRHNSVITANNTSDMRSRTLGKLGIIRIQSVTIPAGASVNVTLHGWTRAIQIFDTSLSSLTAISEVHFESGGQSIPVLPLVIYPIGNTTITLKNTNASASKIVKILELGAA